MDRIKNLTFSHLQGILDYQMTTVMTNTFPFNATRTLDDVQATQAFALRKMFPGFVRDAKGTERGGLKIILQDDCRTISIGATKKGFLNMVDYKITAYFEKSKVTHQVQKAKPTQCTQFLELGKKATHITLFGSEIPLPKEGEESTTFTVQRGGGSIGSHTGVTQSELSKTIQEIVLHQSIASEKTPSLGKAKSGWLPGHSWTEQADVRSGDGELYRPAKPPGWFGLADIEDHARSMSTNLRKAKVEAKIQNKRRNHENTDQDGNILDLQEHLAATAEEEAKDEPIIPKNEESIMDGWGSDDDEQSSPTANIYDEVPDSWED